MRDHARSVKTSTNVWAAKLCKWVQLKYNRAMTMPPGGRELDAGFVGDSVDVSGER